MSSGTTALGDSGQDVQEASLEAAVIGAARRCKTCFPRGAAPGWRAGARSSLREARCLPAGAFPGAAWVSLPLRR